METYESTKKNNLEIITEIGNLNAFINSFLDPLIMILGCKTKVPLYGNVRGWSFKKPYPCNRFKFSRGYFQWSTAVSLLDSVKTYRSAGLYTKSQLCGRSEGGP